MQQKVDEVKNNCNCIVCSSRQFFRFVQEQKNVIIGFIC